MKRLLLISLLLSSTALAQETAYITDVLQLGLHRAEDTSDSPFRNLVSGTELTVLERRPNYARVRTTDGAEGWVRSAFLVDEKPARLRVAELESEIERLERELAAAIEARDSVAGDVEHLVAQAERDIAIAAAERDTLARLQQENDDYAERFEQYRGALPWKWVVAALVVMLGAGFAGGWFWLDASIRRRYGGFRVF